MLRKVGTTEDLIVSLDDIGQFVGLVDTTDESELLTSMIKTATTEIEDITNRKFVSQTYELKVPTLPKYLPKQPTISIESIEYMVDGVYVTVPGADYYIYEELGLSCIDSENISLAPDNHRFAVKINFTAGYEIVPEDIKSFVKVRVATLYEYRESITPGATSTLSHMNSIINRYKIRSL